MANRRLEKFSLAGGALAAIAASLCCLAPLVLVTIGVSGAWISDLTAFEPYRPYALGIALACMGLAYRRIFRAAAPEACEPEAVCADPRVASLYRGLFWIVTAMVLIAIVSPYTGRFFT
jgi:mercuric ion transport protein